MKKIRSLLSLLLVLVLGLSLAACAQPAAEEPTAAPAVSEQPEASAAPAASEEPAAPAEETADVVVIGAGGAGLIAANDLRAAGKNVVLLEKRAMTGGNTAMAGFFAAADTKFHKEFGVTYTVEDHYNNCFTTDGVNPEFARLFVDHAGETAEWLIDTLGIKVTSVSGREIYAVDEETRAKLPNQLVMKLTEKVQADGVDLRLENEATGLIAENGAVTGVRVSGPDGEYTISCSAVLIASGGFSANQEMLAEYAPKWAGLATSNTSATTGDGIRMAQAIGAGVSSMDELTINPTFYDNNGATMSVSGVRYEGGILVDYDGNRFGSEMGDYNDVSDAEMTYAGGKAYAIMDANALGCNPSYCVTADTIEELAGLIGMDPAVLTATVERYRTFYDNGVDEDFGRTDMRSRIDTPPYYAIPVFCGVHHTRGGLTIDLRGQVLDTAGAPISGLYAAGEVTDNGMKGTDPVAVGFTFGRLAAKSLLEDAQ